jgi:hypothetical protein
MPELLPLSNGYSGGRVWRRLRQKSAVESGINKGKAIPVTGHGGPQGCETSRSPHFLDTRFADGGEVVSLTRRSPFTHQEDSWHSFLLESESTSGL